MVISLFTASNFLDLPPALQKRSPDRMHMLMIFMIHVGYYFFCASAISRCERLVEGTEDVDLWFYYRVLVVCDYDLSDKALC